MRDHIYCIACGAKRPDTHHKCPACGIGDGRLDHQGPKSIPGHIPDLTHTRTGEYIAECSCGEFLRTQRFSVARQVLEGHIHMLTRAAKVRQRRLERTR